MLLTIILTTYVLINLAIGIYDFSFYRIPNALLGALIVLYGFYAPLYMGLEGILGSLAVFSVTLAIGFGLYAFKFIGAGDAKYLAVAALWMGTKEILSFILIVSLIGGLLSIIYLLLIHHTARLSDWVWIQIQKIENNCSCFQSVWVGSGTGAEKGKRENVSSRMIPYGIAIAAGAIIVMLCNPITL